MFCKWQKAFSDYLISSGHAPIEGMEIFNVPYTTETLRSEPPSDCLQLIKNAELNLLPRY